MKARPKNFVTETPAAHASEATEHFKAKLVFEADCWDVHATEELDDRGFVLVDARSAEAYQKGHIPGAIHIPHAKLTAERLEKYAAGTLFVVYCAGPHCNASTRAAIRLSELGRPVKEMVDGVTGWIDEGFSLVGSEA